MQYFSNAVPPPAAPDGQHSSPRDRYPQHHRLRTSPHANPSSLFKSPPRDPLFTLEAAQQQRERQRWLKDQATTRTTARRSKRRDEQPREEPGRASGTTSSPRGLLLWQTPLQHLSEEEEQQQLVSFPPSFTPPVHNDRGKAVNPAQCRDDKARGAATERHGRTGTNSNGASSRSPGGSQKPRPSPTLLEKTNDFIRRMSHAPPPPPPPPSTSVVVGPVSEVERIDLDHTRTLSGVARAEVPPPSRSLLRHPPAGNEVVVDPYNPPQSSTTSSSHRLRETTMTAHPPPGSVKTSGTPQVIHYTVKEYPALGPEDDSPVPVTPADHRKGSVLETYASSLAPPPATSYTSSPHFYYPSPQQQQQQGYIHSEVLPHTETMTSTHPQQLFRSTTPISVLLQQQPPPHPSAVQHSRRAAPPLFDAALPLQRSLGQGPSSTEVAIDPALYEEEECFVRLPAKDYDTDDHWNRTGRVEEVPIVTHSEVDPPPPPGDAAASAPAQSAPPPQLRQHPALPSPSILVADRVHAAPAAVRGGETEERPSTEKGLRGRPSQTDDPRSSPSSRRLVSGRDGEDAVSGAAPPLPPSPHEGDIPPLPSHPGHPSSPPLLSTSSPCNTQCVKWIQYILHRFLPPSSLPSSSDAVGNEETGSSISSLATQARAALEAWKTLVQGTSPPATTPSRVVRPAGEAPSGCGVANDFGDEAAAQLRRAALRVSSSLVTLLNAIVAAVEGSHVVEDGAASMICSASGGALRPTAESSLPYTSGALQPATPSMLPGGGPPLTSSFVALQRQCHEQQQQLSDLRKELEEVRRRSGENEVQARQLAETRRRDETTYESKWRETLTLLELARQDLSIQRENAEESEMKLQLLNAATDILREEKEKLQKRVRELRRTQRQTQETLTACQEELQEYRETAGAPLPSSRRIHTQDRFDPPSTPSHPPLSVPTESHRVEVYQDSNGERTQATTHPGTRCPSTPAHCPSPARVVVSDSRMSPPQPDVEGVPHHWDAMEMDVLAVEEENIALRRTIAQLRGSVVQHRTALDLALRRPDMDDGIRQQIADILSGT